MTITAQKILMFDQKKDNDTRDAIAMAIERSITNNQPIQLLLFTCSTIRADKLFSDTPWEYVSLDPIGNNLERDIPRLQQILQEIKSDMPVQLTIIIGNTDPYYIYLQQFKNFPEMMRPIIWKNFIERWSAYRDQLNAWINIQLPETKVDVLSWYVLEKEMEQLWQTSFEEEYEAAHQKIDQYSSQEDFAWELRQLSKQFVPGAYFASLEKPDGNLLKDWVRRKFTEYALQGAWLARSFPNAILIQNEKPSDLRSKMYQPILKKRSNTTLPIIYFFGVDNQGYA